MSSVHELTPDLDNDILYVKGIQMTTKSFRACVFILDELLSCYDCHQFLIPVPPTAYVYHKEIAHPMDFRTLEFNLYNDKYKEFHEFIIDLNLIWENAKQFHRSFDPIYQQADNLHKRFENIVTFLDGGERPYYLSSATNSVDMVTDTLLPEEKIENPAEIHFPMYKEVEMKRKTNLYFVQAVQEKDPLIRKLRGYANVKFLFQTLNSAFFNYIETNSSNNNVLPLPRFYIAKNRTLLQQARVDPDGILAIMCNAQLTKLNDDIIQVRSTVIHCEPMDETHNFDEDSMDKGEQYEYCPKAWLKLKIIRIIRDVTSIINSEMDKNYFKKVYHTFKISTKSSADIKKVGNQALAKEFAQSIIEPKSGNPGISTVSRSSSPQPSMSKGKTASPYTSNSTPPIKKPFLASTSRSASPSPRLRTTTNSTTRSTSSDNMGSSESKNLITIRPPHRRSSKVRQEEEKETDLEHQESRLSHTASAEETSAELSNRPLTVRLLLKNTPSDGTKQKTSLEDQPDNESRKPMVVPHERRVPTVVSVKGEDSDDETASYEYSDSEASDHYQKQDNKHDLATEEKDDDEQEASAYEDAEDNNSLKPSPSPADVEGSDIPIGMSRETSVGGSPFLTIKSETEEMSLANITYPTGATEQWMKVLSYATEKNVPAIDISKYKEYQSALPNAEGYFKHVFYAPHDRTKVIQTFKRMSLSQRTTEVVGLIALKGKPHIGQITEVLQEGEGGEVIGLCMQRYEKTLKHYTHAHSHHRLTAYQKMDLVVQMLESMKTIHEAGIAHRDLSEVNFMVNSTNETLVDGSQKAELFLIDFGKSVFVNPSDYRRWWVQQKEGERNSDTIPKNKEELEYWCQKLPWVRAKPDHGYRLYRSIQTLPKNRLDTENLPWLIHPVAEDLYSIGTLIWKTFSETEPWSGMLDTDLKGLREKVKDDYSIEKALQREVHGELSRKLLLKFLKVEPLQRESASEALDWIKNVHNKNGLIREWEQYAPVGRQKRHAKALFRYDEEQAQSNSARKKMKQQQHQQ